MNKIEFALKLAKDCTYADEMTEGAKEHLRNVIDEALKEVLPQAFVSGRSEQLKCEHEPVSLEGKYTNCKHCTTILQLKP